VDGNGIYETLANEVWQEGDIYFTETKDSKHVFAFTERWPGKELLIQSIKWQKVSKVYLFGYKKPLKWTWTNNGVKIDIPETLQSRGNRPCEYAWIFQFEVN